MKAELHMDYKLWERIVAASQQNGQSWTAFCLDAIEDHVTLQECIDKWKRSRPHYRSLKPMDIIDQFIKDLEEIQKYEEAKLKHELSKTVYTDSTTAITES